MREADHLAPLPPSPHPLRALLLALLLALVAFTLFPLEWLGLRWQAFGRALDGVFADDLRHAVGHAGLFGLLGLLALGAFPTLRTRPWRYLGILMLAALGQELFQLLFKQRPLAFDDGRDLLVDLLGLALAFALARVWQRRSVKAMGDRR